MHGNLNFFGLLIVLLSPFISASEINGRFSITTTDSFKVAVLLQVNSGSGTEAIGGATIVFGFDTAGINLTANPVKNVDYIFHNFCGGQYSPATITRPVADRIWINIDLPYSSSNNGTIVSDTTGWTDVLTIYFDMTGSGAAANLNWLTGSPFWSIYEDDNLTLMNPGIFQNIAGNVPVELISFTAESISNEIILKWTTGSEINNQLFEIQRSFNESDFNTIGIVEGKGTTSLNQDYTYTDNIITAGKYSYRLKQLDFQGSFAYSDIIEIDANVLSSYKLEQNFPNPFNPSTTIRWQSPKDTHQTLKVYDILGNEVATLVDEFRQAGNYEIVFNSDNLASGVYICRLQTSEYTEIKKMVLLR